MKFTRREILTAFLGLPVALSVCRSSRNDIWPDGEIIGAADSLGHKLRDGLRPQPSSDNWRKAKVVIVGGGVAGLAAAWRLQKKGFADFVLLELENDIGGTSRSGVNKVTAYPWGAHYLPAPTKENPDLIALLDEMGTLDGRTADGDPIIAEQFLCRDPQERVFYRGRWHEGLYLRAGASEEDLRQFTAFQSEVAKWVAWRDRKGRRAFAIPIGHCSDDTEATQLDKISIASWLDQRGLTSQRLCWYVEYACRDDYGTLLPDTSAWAGLFYFCSRVAKQGEDAEPLITWPEGNGKLVHHLFQAVKERVQLGCAVSEVIPTENGVEVTAIRDNQAIGWRSQHVIFAAPRFLAHYLIRPYRDNAPDYLKEFEYGAWLVANLTLRNRPEQRGFPLCWDNVIYDSPSLGYVLATHQRGPEQGPTVFTYYYPLCDSNPREARTRLLATDWRGWADVALTDLRRAHPEIRALTERLDIMRWGHAMIRPRPNFIWSGARQKASQAYRGIHFAHSDLSGIALFEEAFYHGLRAADEIL